ncbi:hypothetical protein ACYSNW_00870 [Enterococcus sp. LJL99]
MKKGTCFFMVSLLTILVGCKKEDETKVKLETIDTTLVQKIVGEWQDDSYDYDEYIISVDNQTIHFNSEILSIISTENNKIYTNEKNDKKSHYTFVVENDAVIVYPSYEIEQTSDEIMVGGDLAPITLKKSPEISTTNILGSWKSIESNYPAFIRVKATFDPDQIELIIEQNEETTNSNPILLTLESKSHSSLTYLNEDKTVNYTFSNYENRKLILGTSATGKDVIGEGRPYILERVQ